MLSSAHRGVNRVPFVACRIVPPPDEIDREEGHSRAILLADTPASGVLRDTVLRCLPAGWDVERADRFERALFLLSFDCWDILVVDESFCGPADHEGLSWLADRAKAPVVYLADIPPEIPANAFAHTSYQWLPRSPVLGRPALLSVALRQAARWRELSEQGRETDRTHGRDHRQVTRLLNMLWEVVPSGSYPGWFSQRSMLERLHEEIAHAERHGNPLAVLIAEARVGRGEGPASLAWVAERLVPAKRRGEVVGQYGPHGFMLLLHATAAGAAGCCRRLRGILEQSPPPVAELGGPLLFSFGEAVYAAGDTPRSLLCRAERNLARATSTATNPTIDRARA
jgi:GGDEF domain-containing protein